MSPQSLPLQLWTSFTLPIAPAWIVATTVLWTGCEWIWMPICETIFRSFATSASLRASWIDCASGF